MKKIISIVTIVFGLVLFFSACEKNDKEPKLDLQTSTQAELTNPTDGTAIVLTLADSANPFLAEWSETKYNVSGDGAVPLPTYSLQMVLADSSFDGAKELYNTKDLFFETSYYSFNNTILGMGIEGESTTDFDLQVVSGVSGANYTEGASESIRLTVTTFTPPAPATEKLIYLLGDATPAGWDAAIALPMAKIDDGTYARVETLDPAGEWFKFISIKGLWAPQWGTDETGTAELGPLVYRPDEATADPPAIPRPDILGEYYIEADTIGLEYRTFLTSGELYLVGGATTVGWDAGSALQFTEIENNVFEIITDLTEGNGGMKFLEVQGNWAPQWGINADPSFEGGLSYRPDEVTTDPPEVPSPGVGTFKITVDLTTISYTIVPQ